MNKKFVSALKKIVIEAGNISITAREKGLTVEIKEDNSPVTNADKEISSYIHQKLTELDHLIPVICEERPISKINKEHLFWLVDPIDGTRSYIKNKDTYTINIALIDKGIPVMGFIYQPPLKKLYFTDEENNFCMEFDDKQEVECIKPFLKPTISCATDDFVAIVSSHNISAKTQEYIKGNNFSQIIAIPSSIKLCMIAEGSGDVYPKFSDTMAWDIAAGHAIIKTAGGEVVDINGQALSYDNEDFRNPHFLAYSKRWVRKGVTI